jgi:sulfur dioxygenase
MLVRQLFDSDSSTYTYLLADETAREAVLIDAVRERVHRDLTVLRELGLTLRYVLDTHVHADHVTAASALRAQTGAQTVAGSRGPSCADVHVSQGDQLRVGSLVIDVLETPGHTDDSVSYLSGRHAFTGDALMIRLAGRTDFQNGDPGQLYDSITRVLFALPDDTEVHPAHDYQGLMVSTIGEEKRWNSRIAGRSREDFVKLMNGLGLPPPKRLAEVLLSNRAGGRVDPSAVREVDPSALNARPKGARILDVRDADDFVGALGHHAESENIPLPHLKAAAQYWSRQDALYVICRTGSRSVEAADQLRELGFTNLSTVRGGMEALVSHGLSSAPARTPAR